MKSFTLHSQCIEYNSLVKTLQSSTNAIHLFKKAIKNV